MAKGEKKKKTRLDNMADARIEWYEFTTEMKRRFAKAGMIIFNIRKKDN